MRASQTWNTRVAMNRMLVTSSTAEALSAEAIVVTRMKRRPVIPFILRMFWMIQVKKPRSRNPPTTTIIPTRKSMTSREQWALKHSSFRAPVRISTGRPMNAIARRKFQKNNVARMMIKNTVTDSVCWPVRPQEKKVNAPTAPLMSARIKNRPRSTLVDIWESAATGCTLLLRLRP